MHFRNLDVKFLDHIFDVVNSVWAFIMPFQSADQLHHSASMGLCNYAKGHAQPLKGSADAL